MVVKSKKRVILLLPRTILLITVSLLCGVVVDAFCCRGTSHAPHFRRLSLLSTTHGHDILHGHKTVPQLKAELKLKGLKVSGVKAELIERLNLAIKEENAGEEQVDGKAEAKEDSLRSLLPDFLYEKFIADHPTPDNDEGHHTTLPSLLPIQKQAFPNISAGLDTVVFAPTGSGKTLGYVLPLFTKLLGEQKDGRTTKRKRYTATEYYRRHNTIRNHDDSIDPSTPSILIMVPSRELAQQVGKVCTRYHRRVATVVGGVPLQRHVSMLRKHPDVVVGTPGRIRELMREQHLSTEALTTVVLDEADVLLNFEDQPEVELLLNSIQNDYQLVLVSATINARVRDFCSAVMDNVVIVQEGAAAVLDQNDPASPGSSQSTGTSVTTTPPMEMGERKLSRTTPERPKVRHWHMAARSSARSGLAVDLISTLSPRIVLVFLKTKMEANQVAEEMAETVKDATVSVLHGDMTQVARSRTVAALRRGSSRRTRILCATDVASRGLDLPGVDLVLQFGVPRQAGREGTYDVELYTHRTGRAGRIGGDFSRSADAILMYDSAEGESRVLAQLEKELECDGIAISPRPLPSAADILEAAYKRARDQCTEIENQLQDGDKVQSFFREKLESEFGVRSGTERDLLDKLAVSMMGLSGLGGDGGGSERSLLTADPKDRTVRVWSSDSSHRLSPTEVTRFVKGLGSGKLGRVTVCKDGSAVFDLTEKRSSRLLRAAQEYHSASDRNESATLHVELPSSLPC